MKAWKWVGRTLFLDPFAVRLCLVVVLLFTTIPPVKAVVGPYIKVLLAWGAVVLVADLFTRRRALRNRYAGFLALFTGSYAISILLNRSAGLVGNVSELAYMILFFFVLFAYDPDGSPERVKWEICTLSRVFVVITALTTLVCLATFVFSINFHYVVETGANYDDVVAFGMMDNRLYGLYNPNAGSMLNLLSSAFSLLLMVHGVRRWERVALGINLVLQYVCLLLTLSRTSWYMYVVFMTLFAFFVVPWHEVVRRPRVCELARTGGTVLVAALLILLATPVKTVLVQIPSAVQSVLPEDFGKNETPSISNESPGGPLQSTPSGTDATVNRQEDEEGGLLTGRQYLWKSGWEAFLRQPLFGTTHGGLYDATADFISDYWHRYVHSGGLHNMAFMVLACSGGVGFLVLLSFLLLSGVRALKWLWRRRGDRSAALCNGLIVMLLTILGTEMFESRLLYVVTVFGAVFWVLYGYAMRLVDACEPEKAARSGLANRWHAFWEKRRCR